MKIMLVGDYDQAVVAHQAIPRAIDLAAQSLAAKVEQIWIRTAELNPHSIKIERSSRAGDIYQSERVLEEYHCGFGVNQDLLHIFEGSELKFSGHDDNGEPRVCEIPAHRFYIGTAFQLERSALRRRVHPLISALSCSSTLKE